MSERLLTLLFGTPINLSNNLSSNLGGVDRTGSALTLGVLQTFGDVKLGSEKSGLDQEIALVSGVQDSQSGGVARQPDETEDGVNWGIRKFNVERGVAGESVDGEFATRKVFSGRKEGDVAVDRAVRGFDEELGEIIPFIAGSFLPGFIYEGDVDGDGRIPGLENQEFSGGEVSNDDIILGPKVTTVNAQSLRILVVSNHAT